MVANQEALGPSVGPIPARSFDAQPPTAEKELDRRVERLHDHAREFARLNVATKITLLEEIWHGTREVAGDWVAAACRAKGISLDAPVAGEEWIAGPALTLRNMRFLIRSLREIQQRGAPVLADKALRDLAHGAVAVRVTPYDSFDGALYGGIHAETWLLGRHPPVRDRRSPGVVLQEEGARGTRLAGPRRRQRRVHPADGRPLQDVRRRQRVSCSR